MDDIANGRMSQPLCPGKKWPQRLPLHFNEVWHIAVGGEGTDPVYYIETQKSKHIRAAKSVLLGCDAVLHIPNKKKDPKAYQQFLVGLFEGHVTTGDSNE